MPKPLFGGGQNLRLAMCLGINDAIGMQAHGCESRGEEIAASNAGRIRRVAEKALGSQSTARRV